MTSEFKFLGDDKQAADAASVQVERADQDRINEFGRLNDAVESLKGEVESLKTALANLDDVSDELLLADSEHVQYLIGGSFFTLTKDDAEARLAVEKEQLQAQVSDCDARIAADEAKLAQLKLTLKAKFGNAINLDA
jgi:prefoldin subunit 4